MDLRRWAWRSGCWQSENIECRGYETRINRTPWATYRVKSRRSVLENKMLFLEFPGLSWGHDSLVMIASERLSLMKILLTHKQQARACKRSTQPTYQRPQILFIRSLCSCLSFFFISSVLFLFFSFCFGRLFCSVFFFFFLYILSFFKILLRQSSFLPLITQSFLPTEQMHDNRHYSFVINFAFINY